MRITAKRRLQYAIGHRVVRHESKCRHLHGHNFVFFLKAEAYGQADASGEPILQDDLGRVIDFGVLKHKFGAWIEEYWDHGMVLWGEDYPGLAAMTVFEQHESANRGSANPFKQKVFLLPYNPTAENLAKYLLEVVGPHALKDTGVRLVSVEVYETENGIAEASL
jgi:6-pyruvoyltetrahydropterin/6-carboxytetrahydropterin synthase